ncbi:tetratricopeptide repeat protein [Litorivicinus lipolyticus]|uniref:Tetratricopeptide repeat protein n=1 Tax=Litorivicinus lipolyticus TaxID=418701 RepID=A0A5Q2QF91_9GAMM|nr:tetratricopeptide repeat protein [Litorivicinus lipolyticus]QGG80510.1 tetratricopeptide repeat protein [Litorivicinus lipolyticus]
MSRFGPAWSTLALVLSGCQAWAPVPVDSHSDISHKSVAQGQVWLAQGHFGHAIEVLQGAVRRNPDDALAWRVLGRAYWHAGIEAMATQAALDPTQVDLEPLGAAVFQLEDYLNETMPGYRPDREPVAAADRREPVVRGHRGITVVDPVWRLE